ncbi:MAG: hypothetical protein ACREDR_35045 [Blastocatellia bacterium]
MTRNDTTQQGSNYPRPTAVPPRSSSQNANGRDISSPATPSLGQRLKASAEGRAFSGRAELRHTNHVLKFVIILLLVSLAWTNYLWLQHADKLSDRQYIVFHDRGGDTSAESVSQYRTGPSDEEIRHQAWEFIRWMLGRDSTNAKLADEEVQKLLTPELRNEYVSAHSGDIPATQRLQQYKKFENVTVGPMTSAMLPPGSRTSISRYDILVSGTLERYSLASQAKLATGPFGYHVRLVPLDKRSLENPYGLLISGFTDVALTPSQGPSTSQKGSPAQSRSTPPPNQDSQQ